MRLYLVRHGIAEPRDSRGDDPGRALTREGRRRLTREVRGLERLGVRFDLLLHSPWTRAAETAALLRPLVDGRTRATPALAAPPSPRLLAQLKGDRVALVGHQPWLGELLAWLALGRRQVGAAFQLKKGGVAWLEGAPAPGRMVLGGLLPPKALRRFGSARG